ncbi:MAG: T9SS type A sorting domain-containing protein [Flavobacteriales bacterium]|nr:T9SS type A sorting domain-containing protein [Flavobacteriales bacterium]
MEVEVQPGAGNSNTIHYYQSVDSKPFNGVSYYRLRQVDYNGDQESFGPITVTCVNFNNTDYALIYPNPTTGEFTVELNAGNAYGNGLIELTDMLGRKVTSRKINIQEGNNIINFKDQHLSAGTYHVSITLNGVSLPVEKLVIK